MSMLSSIIYSVAGLTAFSVWMYHTGDYNRYKVVSVGSNIYVFDKKVGILNQCDSETCHFIASASPRSSGIRAAPQIQPNPIIQDRVVTGGSSLAQQPTPIQTSKQVGPAKKVSTKTAKTSNDSKPAAPSEAEGKTDTTPAEEETADS